jgi:hypothetical protein
MATQASSTPPAGAVVYQTKHPFQGDRAASQLSFAKNEIIYGKPNQSTGNGWLWGNHRGTQGWFPASYVVLAPQPQKQKPAVQVQQAVRPQPTGIMAQGQGQPQAANANANATNMQQRMQSAVFQSSTAGRPQQQQVRPQAAALAAGNGNDLLGMSYAPAQQSNPLQGGGYPSQQPQQGGFGGTMPHQPQSQQPQAATGFGMMQAPGASLAMRSAAGDDPFANMDATPTPSLMPEPSVGGAASIGGAGGAAASNYSSGLGASSGSIGAPAVAASLSMSMDMSQVFGGGPSQGGTSHANASQNTATSPSYQSTSMGMNAASAGSAGTQGCNIFDNFSQARGATVNANASANISANTSNVNSNMTKVTSSSDPLSPAISGVSNGGGGLPSPSRVVVQPQPQPQPTATVVQLPDPSPARSVASPVAVAATAAASPVSSHTPTPPHPPTRQPGVLGAITSLMSRGNGPNTSASAPAVTPARPSSPLPSMVSSSEQSNANAAPPPSLGWGKAAKTDPKDQQAAAMEQARLSQNTNNGMGKSPLGDGESALSPRGRDLSHLFPPTYNPTTSAAFNPYEYLAGPNAKLPKRTFDPLYKTLSYWHLLSLNVYIRGLPSDTADASIAEPSQHYDVLIKAMSFLGHVMDQSYQSKQQNPLLDVLKDNHIALEACLQLMKLIPHSVGLKNVDAAFLNLMNMFVPLIGNMRSYQQLVIPGGWSTLLTTSGDIKTHSHLVLYVLKNQGNGTWSFTVCNMGPEGLEYHPSSIDEDSGREMKQLALTIWDIPSERIMDSTFWTLVFRMQIYPHRRHGAQLLYEHLLPALNSRPLLSNMRHEPIEFLPMPKERQNMGRYYELALLALTVSPMAPAEGETVQLQSFSSKFASLLVRNAAVDLTYRSIQDMEPSSMDYEDARILKLTGRNLANYASTMELGNAAPEVLSETLSDTWSLLDKLLKKITLSSSTPQDQHSHPSIPLRDDFSKGNVQTMQTERHAGLHPMFGRLRRDDFDRIQRTLMGDPMPEAILVPVVLSDSSMPHVATDYQSAVSSLQRICHACSLLLQQRKQIKNAAAFAASAAQYALTTTLVMPHLDPKYCFWRSKPMRRETQTMLLFLIRRICRIYSSSTACVQKSRGLIAIQTIALASAACVADAISRVTASDDPSEFALHYSGLNEGPTDQFGIEAGAFEKLAANLPIYDPRLCDLRGRCLDYLRGISLHLDGSEAHTIFNFDQSMAPLKGDLVLIDQLSIQLALPRPSHKASFKTRANNAAKLISGRNGSIIEMLPEFEYFRDIVFHFKHAVSGESPTPENSDAVDWLPSHATLHWTTKQAPPSTDDAKAAAAEDGVEPLAYRVSAFHGNEQEFVEEYSKEEAQKKSSYFKSFVNFFNKSSAERSKLSAADPTNIINSCSDKVLKGKGKPISVATEDDILHLTASELPTFGHVLSPSDSERFLQFLTVPYIRIPLVLDFFANGDPGRLSALKTKSLQMIVDAALFEPGLWKPADYTPTIEEIPILEETKLHALLATPLGSMFNEIAKSPDVLTDCVIKILDRALDMDVGKYAKNSASGPMILYSIRLAVRVEGYLKFALEHCTKPGIPRPRGLESVDTKKVGEQLQKIRTILDTQAFRILEYWIEPSRIKDVNIACLVHAHLIYLFKNKNYDEFDIRVVSVLLSSQVYLTINNRFSNQVYDDLHDSSDPTKPPPSIQIAQSEIFDILQSQRYHVLKYMRVHPEQADEAMEAVVRVATGTGARQLPAKSPSLQKRHWNTIRHPTCYGRFVPDTEDEKLRDGSYRKPLPHQTFEQWMLHVTTKVVGTEVNVQLSDFTLQNHKMHLLDPKILNHKDFALVKNTACKDASDLACAEVMHTTNRYWWRLVGRRYDVQSWAPDERNYHKMKGVLHQKKTRKFPSNLKSGEAWIAQTLKDKIGLLLPEVSLYMTSDDVSNEPFCELAGWIENPKNANSQTNFTHTLKEVVVWQHPPVIEIYNLKEHGRRLLRVLEYTSNMSLCLHEVPGEPYPDRVSGILSLSAGIPMTTVHPAPSLIVTRSLSSRLGWQTLIPDRFLAGMLPTALLEIYDFWQGEDDCLIGYEREVMLSVDDDDDGDGESGVSKEINTSGGATRLYVKVLKADDFDKHGFGNSSAVSVVERVPVERTTPEVEQRDSNRKAHTLLNILTAPPASLLKRLGMLISRLDNLSHVLVWSETKLTNSASSSDQACSIDVIELPRVKLSFKAKRVETISGKVEHRMYSNDHDGLYISTSSESREVAERLLGNVAHFIVLQNADNDLFVLIPGCALPRRLHQDGSHLSVQIILDRRNQEWIANMGEIRCYLYPVHNCRAFLMTPSLASSMYLMVLYFITGAYQDVFRMVDSCVSEDLSPEELQIFNQLEFLGNDHHPDAHACRLKLSAVTVGLGDTDKSMKCPWDIRSELVEYVKKHPYVSSACRLSPEEEILLLKLARGGGSKLPLTLMNRKAFVTAVSNLDTLNPGDYATVKLGVQKIPPFDNFDSGPDETILRDPKNTMIGSKLFGTAYNRTDQEQLAFGGINALTFINNMANAGYEISSGSYGFPLLYDLLTGSCPLKLHPSDRTHNWGRLFVRLLPSSEYNKKKAEISLLRILSENAQVAQHPHLPKLMLDSGMKKFQGMFKGTDAISRLLGDSNTFLRKESIRPMIRLPEVYEECESQSTIVLKPTSAPSDDSTNSSSSSGAVSRHRLWAVPRVADYSQSEFELEVANCASVNIPVGQLKAFATKPLAPINLDHFVKYLSRSECGLPHVSGEVPFDCSGDKVSKTHCSISTLNRIATDVRKYAQKTNSQQIPTLIGFTQQEVHSFHRSPPTLHKGQSQLNNLITSLYTAMDFDRKSLWNLMQRALAIACSDERRDTPFATQGADSETKFLLFRLGQCSEREPSAWFELLVASLLSTTAEHDARNLNPFLSRQAYRTVTSLTIVAMLTSIRIGQTHRALTNLTKLVLLLRTVQSSNPPALQQRLCQEISLLSQTIATDVTNERHYMTMSSAVDPTTIRFDPRFLVFEFTYSIMLRKSQVMLVNKFMTSLKQGKSMCHQMIMGAGKTTVVAPLLALMLADGKSLVTQVVPHALLEMSRGVMREKFAAVVRKPVFTFTFDRSTPVTRNLYMKLIKARDAKAVICATPTSIKSFMLKFVEMMRHIHEKNNTKPPNRGMFDAFRLSSIAQRFKDSSQIVELKVNPEDVYYSHKMITLFREGVLLLDEVDLLLHPLKSELNWPIGIKEPLDFTQSRSIGSGMRWEIAWHLLDAIFYSQTKQMTVEFGDSREAILLLDQIAATIQRGIAEQHFQHTPHIVLLDKKFYQNQLKPLMARWQLLYLRHKRLPKVDDRMLLSFMMYGPDADKQAASAVEVGLSDDFVKMLNLSERLIRHFVPYVLSKINRVQYGLLSKDDLDLSLESDPNVSLARRMAAIPFIGKDVPSRASQFSHPDVVIGLTIMAYRYEGLRKSDFVIVINDLREKLEAEYGPYHKRASSLKYASWVEHSGGKVRGPKKSEQWHNSGDDEQEFDYAKRAEALRTAQDEIWPLHLLDLKDKEHLDTSYKLLRRNALVMMYYLNHVVFPLVMEHHLEKINASGQDLGGDMLFKRRVGFSGTPSDLLPEELGQCEYEECVDGQILNYLTSEQIVTSRMLDKEWSVTKLLDIIAQAKSPPYHALIDTGALVTGMSNYEVAKYLIANGLPNDFDGVVFLDHKDRKMILLRHGMCVVRASQASVPPHRRFSFYDQIHTTGMDIHQCIDAKAVLTLGKDMTFRDYAQGAFRMRGIGKGQTIELFIIPEVMNLIAEKNTHLQKHSNRGHNPLAIAAPVAVAPAAGGGGSLLDFSAPAIVTGGGGAYLTGKPLLVAVSAWLTINGMRSENMQFNMLCRQSIENVWRKRGFYTLTSNYPELSKLAFSGKLKELAQNAAGDAVSQLEKMLRGDKQIFGEDVQGIKAVVQGTLSQGQKAVGVAKLEKCIRVLGERIDFTVPNHIPQQRSLSENLKASIDHQSDLLVGDYDRAVVDKILMVLVTSESTSMTKQLKTPQEMAAADEENEDDDLHKEQVAEEEVLQEEEEEEEEEEEVRSV